MCGTWIYILYIEGLKDYMRFTTILKLMSLMNMKKVEDYLPILNSLRTPFVYSSYVVRLAR